MTPNAEETTPDKAPDAPELDPRRVRENAGLDPSSMAALLGMSDFGYRAWEAGQRKPGGPAWRLLALIDADPKGMAARLAEL